VATIDTLTAQTAAALADTDILYVGIPTDPDPDRKMTVAELRTHLDAELGFLPLAGGTMTGDISMSSAGIDFGSTSLDAYEVGTWTPDLEPFNEDGGTTTITYTNQQGTYLRVGDWVLLQWYLLLTSFSSGANAARDIHIVDLPFTLAGGGFGGSNRTGLGIVGVNGSTSGTNWSGDATGVARATSNTNDNGNEYIEIRGNDPGDVLEVRHMSGNEEIQGSLWARILT